MNSKKIIAAVSGGVDSAVMLHLLLNNPIAAHTCRDDDCKLEKYDNLELVVAHFDHAMRPSSQADAAFVQGLAKKHNLAYETERAKTELKSEDQARQARWAFLRKVAEQYGSDVVATGHHQDDVLETMMINVLRGTGWRGLISLRNTDEIIRPLLGWTKADIYQYALEYYVEFVEDETNIQNAFLRNRIRRYAAPQLSESQVEELLAIRRQIYELEASIEPILRSISTNVETNDKIDREQFVLLPRVVQAELVRQWLLSRKTPINERIIEEIVVALKVAKPGRSTEISKALRIKHQPNTSHFILT